MKRGPRLITKVAGAVVAAGGSTLLALNGAHVVTLTPTAVVAAAAATGVVAVGTAGTSAFGQYRGDRRQAAEQSAAYIVRPALLELSVKANLDLRKLGISVWLVRHRMWRTDVLDRLLRERPSFSPAASKIKWTVGKGIIGRCVQDGADFGDDVAQSHGPFMNATEAEWLAAPEGVRLGLSFADFRALRGKYGAVVATPLVDDTKNPAKVVGCLALDGPAGSFDQLWQDEIRSFLAAAGVGVIRQLRSAGYLPN
ncbi:hypothetical protein [Petropleomorpha daqingensis]|uniref:GAF domain-containing protein n=1 Tax=Petropleomorpha daqingensis TaxID=2026353 RepID=A0A853CEY9_9ACTN|nr:hypothetical protein [Petropleomorpha daqingensis]NYJ05142.1 hypothetical protein [Petropleomorpha daqingensis]